MIFQNRYEAGRCLAAKLEHYRDHPSVVVLALPRGGVPVGYEVARSLRAPLDIFLVRKLGVPGQEELALGAIATGGVRVLNQQLLRILPISAEAIEAIAAQEQEELERREQAYRGDRPRVEIQDRIAILVDDGLATGASMRAAALALRQQAPARIVVAVPVGARDTCSEFEADADETVCGSTPEPFYAVGYWYGDFEPTTDDEVRQLLAKAAAERFDRPHVAGHTHHRFSENQHAQERDR